MSKKKSDKSASASIEEENSPSLEGVAPTGDGVGSNTEPVPKVPLKNRIAKWFVKYKSQLLKASIVLSVAAGIVIGVYFGLNSVGVNIFSSGPPSQEAQDFFARFGVWVFLIFLVIYVLQSILLSIVPGNTTMFVLLGITVFSNFVPIWASVLFIILCNYIASIVLFYLGRFAGRGFLYWLFGKHHVEKHLQKITDKGVKIVPGLMLIPFMPNDLLSLVCGSSKMKFWHFVIIIAVCRAIEILMIFSYTYLVDIFIRSQDIAMQVIVINVLLIDIFLIYHYYKWFIKMINKHILRRDFVMVKKDYYEEEMKKR